MAQYHKLIDDLQDHLMAQVDAFFERQPARISRFPREGWQFVIKRSLRIHLRTMRVALQCGQATFMGPYRRHLNAQERKGA